LRLLSLFAAVSLSLFISSTPVLAGPLTGRILDPSGRPVPGAQVILSTDRGVQRTALTDPDGRFALSAPDTGRFDVLVAAPGLRAEPTTLTGTPSGHDLGAVTLSISAISESVVVSAAQVDVALSQAAASVTVITAREIQDRQLHTVAEALRSVPGLAVAATGGFGAVTGVFPRGGESNYTLVFVDDVPVNGFGGDFDFAHLSTANVERIEVVRGPQSALFGSNAIGAVIRVVTRRGGPPAGAASLEAGSFGTSRFTASGSGSLKAWEWGAAAERFESDGLNGRRTHAGHEVRNDDYLRHALSATGGWRDEGGAAVRGNVSFSRDDRGIPGAFGSNPIGVFSGIDEVSRGDYHRWAASLSGALPVNERVRTQAQLGFSRTAGEFASPFGLSESTSRRLNARLQADVALAPALDISAGFDVLTERAGSTYITGSTFTPVPIERLVAGYFTEARWNQRQRLFVTAGLRLDDIRRAALESSPDAFSPRPATASESIVSVNPKVSAAWFVRPDAGNHTKARASIGTGIRPPDGFEIAFTDNPALKPERSISAEAGIEQALLAGRVLVEATGFVNEYDDLIVAVGSFAESSRYRTDNISNARARGFELAGTARTRLHALAPIDVEARLGYTLVGTEILAVDQGRAAPPPFSVGDPLLRRPRHQLSLDFMAQTGPLTAYFRGGGRGRALDVEPNYGTFGGLFYSSGYSAWNAGASWRLARRIDLFGRVTNLFDRTYEEALGFPAHGRGAVAGLRVAAGR
jgi:outer membrane cobalamin receptor